MLSIISLIRRKQMERNFRPDLTGINPQKSAIIKPSRICTNLIPHVIMVSSYDKRGDIMTNLDSLKKLVRENGYLYTKDVTSAGIRREQLKKYLDEGSLIRESRGIYSFADSVNDEFALLQSRCKKGVFSYGTALYFHGLSDRFPQMVSMTVPKTYNVFYLKEELFHVEFHRIKPSLWSIGMMEMVSPQGGKIMVYDRERCICDMIRSRKQTDPQVFSQAVKGYFSSKERDNIRLMEYAKKFHIEEKVQEYMEIL